MNIIRGNQIIKRYGNGAERKTVLDQISVDVLQGEFLSIMGPSGSGKSTLLYLLSGMDRLDAGQVFFEEKDLSALRDNDLADLRRTRMGFVFQQPAFLRNLNLLDNIILPAVRENRLKRKEIVSHAQSLMDSMGIADLGMRGVTEVSGGQLQRAGICRALINDPGVIFGDEPTGALNSAASQEIMALLADIHQRGTTVILVTHDPKVAAASERVIFLSDGQIVSEMSLSAHERTDLKARVAAVTEEMLNVGI